MKQNSSGSSLIIQGLILAILGFVALNMWFDSQTKNRPEQADIPTSAVVETVAGEIEEIDPKVGPEGEGDLEEGVPSWQDVTEMGDIEIIRTSLMEQYASFGTDERVSTAFETGALAGYCIQAHWPAHDENKPLADQVRDGSVNLIPGTQYCDAEAALGELWAGVPQEDLLNFQVNIISDTPKIDPVHMIITRTQSVDIVLNVRFGYFGTIVRPGNAKSAIFGNPSGIAIEWLNWTHSIGDPTNTEYIWGEINKANELANELLGFELIAPMNPDGTRSMSNLDELKKLLEYHWNNPSPDQWNPWPYDNLLREAQTAALAAGYTGVNSLKVNLQWPYEEGVWYELVTIGSDHPIKVVNHDDYDPFFHNLYPYYRDEVGTNWIPDVIREKLP